jgi:two-component system NarL family sensor kinase
MSYLKWSGAEGPAAAQIYILILTVSCLLIGAFSSEGRRQNRNLRNYAARLTSAEDLERQRISSELHDDVGQQFIAMKLQLSLLKRQASNMDAVASVREMLGTLISSSQDSVYRLIHGLNPVELEVMGFEQSLREGRLAQLLDASNIDYEVIVEGNSARLPDEVAAVAFRVVQECVSNCVKYAEATKFTVLLNFQLHELSMVAEDNGGGFDVNASQTSFGLNNIATRCKSLGGDWNIASSPAGTRITVSLPCVNV